MGKSQVEKYEQILAQDPGSTVFVELAKTLIAEGDLDRAIQVCEAGLGHHPRSVAARVLFGKALIYKGRPAEAMEQFDRAIAVQKENPHAYNLIAEVLVQKRLYRSALPLLRKAVALQPNDARVREWLDQTQRALQGGPAPILGELAPFQDLEDGPTDPFSAMPLGGDEEVIPGLTSVFQVLSNTRPLEPSFPPPPPPGSSEEVVLDGRELQMEPPTVLALARDNPKPWTQEPFEPPVSPRSFGLLGDLPDPSGVFLGEGNPRTEVSSQQTEAIAQEYERELRKKAAERIAQKSFLQRHGFKLAVSGTLFFAIAVAGFFYFSTRAANQGQDLQDALAAAKKGILQDAPDTDRAALSSLALAMRMAPDNPEPKALSAYAHALTYADYGEEPEHPAKAKEVLAAPGVRERFPHLALASDYYLSSGKARETALAKVLESQEPRAELLEIQGRIALKHNQVSAAVDKFKQALTVDARSVRTLAALANYFKDAGDCERALELFERARQVSPHHPEAVLGTAECQLDQEQELEGALAMVQSISTVGLGLKLSARRTLDEGKLCSALGQIGRAHV